MHLLGDLPRVRIPDPIPHCVKEPIQPPHDLAERVGILARHYGTSEQIGFVGYVTRPDMYKPFNHPTKCSLEQLAYFFDHDAKWMPREYRERFH